MLANTMKNIITVNLMYDLEFIVNSLLKFINLNYALEVKSEFGKLL